MEVISNIPDYDGIGIYAIVDNVSGLKYVGSSRNVKKRLQQHMIAIKAGKGNKGLYLAYNQGHTFHCEIIEKLDYGINEFYLSEREKFYIKELDTINNGFNEHPTPSSSIEELELSAESFKNNSTMYKYTLHLIQTKSQPIIAYDRINIAVPKGKKAIIKAHAESMGESINGYINKAIEEKIEREGSGNGAAVGGKE